MDFNFSLGLLGAIVLLVGAFAFGIAVQLVGRAESGYEWIATSIAGVIGGFVLSEFVIGLRAFEPVYDGLALVPAAIGGVVVGILVAGALRLFITDNTASSHSAA